MTQPESKQTIQDLCPDIRRALVHDFLSRMDDDYFRTFPAEEIAGHIRMSSELDADRRVNARILHRGGREFEIVIVGFDYLSEFSTFCGLLSAFALDIREGDIYSFSRQGAPPGPRRIVDVFRVAVKPGESFDEQRQQAFAVELQSLADLLASGSADVARERLNRFLTEQIEKMNLPLSGLQAPIDLQFDNALSEAWTVMDAESEDSFAFLYAVSNALSMRGIYINKVRIRSDGRQAKDRFFIADRWGRKIENPRDQQRLRMAVAMIKQFTRFLPEAPDPAKAMRHFDQLLDKLVDLGEEDLADRAISFFAESQGMNMLAHLLGSSDFLWDDALGIHFQELLPVLENLGSFKLQPGPENKEALRRKIHELLAENPSASFEERKRIFNWFKDRELFLIDVKHLIEPGVTLMEFSGAVTDLAEVVVAEAAAICFEYLREQHPAVISAGGTPQPFAIFGLGKFGGREMGYASDLELLFVHAAPEAAEFFESLARHIVDFIEARDKGIFHIDLRLRPYGDAGSWATSLEQFMKYYSAEGQAAPFERQALIKLRQVAGDDGLGERVEQHRDAFTYSGARWDWENAALLRQRQRRELVKPGRVNVKYSAGGIVDIEYAVQYLQLLNGRDHPEVRLPNTLEALDRLRRLQIVREADYATLHAAYHFLRKLIDALRIVRGDAADLVLPDESSEEFKSLARRLGYRHADRARGSAMLAADIHERMQVVNAYFVGRFTSHPSEA